jgi:hypothetical protein
MLPNQPRNADYIEELTVKNLQMQEQLRQFQFLTSALAYMLMDDKGKVRINKQTLNQVAKMEQLEYQENSRGAVIVTVTMQEKAKPKPKPKPPAKGKQ